MDFQIDYMLFLAISGLRSGEHGIWEVDESGIRSTLQPSGHSAHDEYQTRRIIQGTQLSFPALASELRRVEQNLQERLTPDWFRALLDCDGKAESSAVLAAAQSAWTQAREEALRRKVAASSDASMSRGDRVRAIAWEEQQAREAELALHGVEQVEALLSPRPNQIVGVGNRSGGIGHDILAAAQKVGTPWATAQVSAELERMAQANDGCVFDANANGIFYKNAKGNDKVLTWKQLKGRLVSVRKTLRAANA